MAKDKFLIVDNFKVGWQRRIDASRIPLGGAQRSINMIITDRGGIAPRGGELLLGTENTASSGVKSIWSFKKSDGNEVLMKSYSDRLEYLSPKQGDWNLIKSGYTPNLVFGFKEHNINPEGVDTLCFGNGIDNYSQWTGFDALLTTTLVGGETEVIVDTVLTSTVHATGTASAVTTTTLTVATPQWANNIWNDFYVHITNGAANTFISRITATTPTQITFTPAIALLAGTPTFEIRQLAVPNTRRAFGTTFTFAAASKTITNPSFNFLIEGFRVNDSITISGSASNNGVFTITNVSATVLTVFQAVVNEAAGAAVTIVTNIAGTIVYNNSTVNYTGVPRDDRFTVASASAGTIGQALTTGPIEFANDPKGNILETLNGQIFVGGDNSKPMTIYRSSLNSSSDFAFSSPRSADEGDIQWYPYGGRRISDIRAQEETLYTISSDSVVATTYTQDANDIAQKNPVIQGVYVGSNGRSWKMDNDFAYVTPDNRVTTLGRVLRKDFRPQAIDIAYPIRREIQRYNTDAVVGVEFRNRGFVGVKSDNQVSANDRVIVYNKDYAAWEGFWFVNAAALTTHDNKLVYGDSYTPNVYQLMTGINKIKNGQAFPINCQWESGFINLRGTGFYLETVSSLAVEGYITSGTTIEFQLFKDFAISPFVELVISGLETQFQDNLPQFTLLGGEPLGTTPLGGPSFIGDPDEDGRRHFIAFLNFNQLPLEYISIAAGSTGRNQDWEIIAFGLNTKEAVYEAQGRIKN